MIPIPIQQASLSRQAFCLVGLNRAGNLGVAGSFTGQIVETGGDGDGDAQTPRLKSVFLSLGELGRLDG